MTLDFDPIRAAEANWRARWGGSASCEAMAAATSVMRVQQLLIGRYDDLLAAFDLTFARYEALVLLSFSRTGALPMSKVGERLMVHPTSATHIIKRLADQQLVERRPNPDDGRGTLAVITDAGRRIVQEATAVLVAEGFALRALSRPEQEQLFALLERVRADAGDFTAGGEARS